MGRKSRGAKDEGVPVWEALERLAPKELCERYKQIADYVRHQIRVFGPGLPPPDPTYDEASALDSRLSQILTSRLESGELIASGIKYPVRNIANPRQDIAPDLWPFLSLKLFNSEAEGEGLKLIALRIRSATHGGPGGETSEGPGEAARSEPQDEPRAPRRGPESLMPLIKVEMIERAGRGELRPTLAEESRFLEGWVKKHHPTFGRPPKAKTIREALREVYNQLKERTEAGI